MDGGADPEEELFNAVSSGDHNEVRNLLRRTANITAKNKDGDTALHIAASEGQEDVIQELIRAKEWMEIVNTKDASGQTALHICCMLEEETESHTRTEQIKSNTRTIRRLLEKGAVATTTDQDGWTALHHAAERGYWDAVRCLVKHMNDRKMDLNQKTKKSGGTALHIAADRGFAGVVDELMSSGASNTTTAWDGETVLHWALQGAIYVDPDRESEDKDEGGGIDLNDEVEVISIDGGGSNQLIVHNVLQDQKDQHDAVFKRILRGTDGAEKWSELLKVARREERIGALQYLMSNMYPRQVADRLRKPLRRIWLAMSESRTQELMELLRKEAREARTQKLLERLLAETSEAQTQELMERFRKEASDKTESMDEGDILTLATSLGKVQTVYWLLRSRRWSKSDINKAKNLPDNDRLNKNAMLWTGREIWNTPFIHDERSGGESYRWPSKRDVKSFGAAIMDFHKVDNQIVSIYYDCDTSSLLHQGEGHGPGKIVERSMKNLGNRHMGGMAANEFSDKNRCYRWINLAINSIPWMKNLAIISYCENDAKRDEWVATWQFLRWSWQELPENRDEESYMRPNCVRANLPQSKLEPGEQSTTSKHDLPMRMALYMPYLTFGPFENTPHDEKSAIKHEGDILHRSRTLDQFYHSIQDDKRARDRDQVFTRYVDRKLDRKVDRKTSPDTNFDILRVNQLWLWVIDDSTVITSTTHGLDESEDPVFQELLKRLSQSQTMFNREATPSSIDSFVKIITSFLINALDNLKVSLKVPSAQAMHENLDSPTGTKTYSLTTVFADSIERNNVKERKLRDKFRTAMEVKTSRSGDLHDSIVQAMNILDDIKDIRDELNIINSVVQEQKTVWSQLLNQSRGSSMRDDTSKEDYESHQWSNTDPDYVLKRVKDLLHEAEKTEHNITSVLELVMNQLNVSEAEEAGRQGKALMVFTIVTGIFLPLSFLASLFALNVSTFPHAGNEVQYQPGWIFGIMFGVALAFILLLLVTLFRPDFGKIMETIMKHLKQPKAPEPTASEPQALEPQTSQPQASQPASPPPDESTPTAGESGHAPWKKWWGWWRSSNSGGNSV